VNEKRYKSRGEIEQYKRKKMKFVKIRLFDTLILGEPQDFFNHKITYIE